MEERKREHQKNISPGPMPNPPLPANGPCGTAPTGKDQNLNADAHHGPLPQTDDESQEHTQ